MGSGPSKKTGNESIDDIYRDIDDSLFGGYKKLALKIDDTTYEQCIRCTSRVSYYAIKALKYFNVHYGRKRYIASSKIMLSGLFKIYDLVSKYDVYKITDLWSQVEMLLGGQFMGSYQPKVGSFTLRDENTEIFRFMVEKQCYSISENNSLYLNMTSGTFYSYLLPIGIGFYDDYRRLVGERIRNKMPISYKLLGEKAYSDLKGFVKTQHNDYTVQGLLYLESVKDKVEAFDPDLHKKIIELLDKND